MEEELISLIRIAGDAIREVYEGGSWDVTLKKDRSPLTQADRASHSILVEGLTRIFPAIPVLSEESDEIPYEVRKKWESYFLIDPLDGTREFVSRVPEFAINIALVQKGTPVIGLIHNPLEQTTFFSERGKGAYKIKDGRAKLPLAAASISQCHVLLSHTDESPALAELLSRIPDHTVKRMGSSLKFCHVAEGRADFYPRLKPSMEWDIAAGTILVEESGGIVCGLEGKRIEYNRQDMLNRPFLALGHSFQRRLPDWKEKLINA